MLAKSGDYAFWPLVIECKGDVTTADDAALLLWACQTIEKWEETSFPDPSATEWGIVLFWSKGRDHFRKLYIVSADSHSGATLLGDFFSLEDALVGHFH